MKLRRLFALRRIAVAALAVTLLIPDGAEAQDKLYIVATLPTYGAIAREVAGERAEVASVARGDEDPHFVHPRPSYAAMIRRADLFITTGLDLELWVPGLLDRANNPRVVEGAPGHVVAYAGVRLLQVPENVSRAGGDVHVYGNPHIHTDPVNAIQIGRNIVDGLQRVDPENAETYRRNLADFEQRVMRRLVGDSLVEMLGVETLFELARSGRFWGFVGERTFQGRPLEEYLGGWLAEAAPFRDKRVVCYHKNWAYFSARFRVECAMYVEPKPGIPATPGHVRNVMDFIRREHIPVLFAANYFSRSQVERVASRTGAVAIMVPEHVDGDEGVDDYFSLIDNWVSRLAAAFGGRTPRSHR